jgi:hypothetical protein
MIYLFFALSVIINGVLAWLCYRIVNHNFNYSKNIYHLMETLDDFKKHLSAVHGLESYHGDETLQSFVEHLTFVCDEIESFKDEHVLEIEEIEIDWEENTEDQTQAEQ